MHHFVVPDEEKETKHKLYMKTKKCKSFRIQCAMCIVDRSKSSRGYTNELSANMLKPVCLLLFTDKFKKIIILFRCQIPSEFSIGNRR